MAVLVLLAVLLAATVHAHPHPALYAASSGTGAPMIRADGMVDTGLVRAMARYPLVTLNATPHFDRDTRVALLLRRLHPGIRILAYDTFGQRFVYLTPGTLWADEWEVVKDRCLYTLEGRPFPYDLGPVQWDWWPNLGDRQVVRGLVAATIKGVAWSGLADGVFWDYGEPYYRGHSLAGSTVDFKRAGFVSLAALDSARAVNTAWAVDTLKTALGECRMVVGN